MDELSLKVEKVTGLSSKSTACGVFAKRVTLVDGTIGTCASCVLIKDGKDDDLATLLRDIFELSTNKLETAGLADGILDAVELCGEATRDYLKSKNLKFSFAHTFFYKNVAYIAKFGDAVRIFVFSPPREEEIKFESGSGPVGEGELFLVATEKFLEKFDVGVFKTAGEVDLEEIIDGLATEISGETDQSEIGAALILAKGETETPKTKEGDEEERGKVPEVSHVGKVEEPGETETGQEKKKVAAILRKVLTEVKNIRRGDIGAVFRLRRNIIVVIGIIALILIISGGLTIRQKIQRGKLAEFNSHLSAASAKYSEAQAILELNRAKAREVLSEADKEVKLALAIQKNDPKAQELAVNITNKLKETEESKNVNFSVLFEAQTEIASLSFMGKNLAVFAGDKILVGNSKDELSTIAGAADTESGFVFSDSAFILASGKVHRVDLKTEKKEDLFDFEAGDIAVFLGNIYLPTADQIAKFVPVEGGYSRSGDYLEEKAQLNSSSRLAIDGSVWVTASSKVLNFLRGKNQNFEISGLSGQIGQLESIYTSSSLDNIYVIDKSNWALLVISKEGVYKKAYQSPEFAMAADVVIADDEKTMYLAVGNKVLKAELK